MPAGTALAEIYGWRATFYAVVAIGIAAVIAIVLLVPATKEDQKGGGFISEIKVLGKLQVWLAMLISALASAGLFAVFTYIKPILTDVSGISTSAVTGVLLLFGAGMTVGNIIGGKLADWKLMPTVIGTLVALMFIHAIFAEVSGNAVAAIVVVFVWGVLTFVIVPPLQMRVVETAEEAPNLAATLNQGAFNVGNASGAWIGGAALTWGVSYQNLPFVGSALAVIAVLVAVGSWVLDRRAGQARLDSDERERLSLEPLAGL